MSNPYQPPATTDYTQRQAGGGEVPAEAVEALRETKPWVTLLAVLGFVGTGFMVLAGLGVMVMDNATLPAAFGVVYVVIAVLYLLPSLLLIRYSSSIGRLVDGAGPQGLIEALRSQRSFWRAVGIMTLVMIVLMFLSVFVGGAAGLFLAKRPH